MEYGLGGEEDLVTAALKKINFSYSDDRRKATITLKFPVGELKQVSLRRPSWKESKIFFNSDVKPEDQIEKTLEVISGLSPDDIGAIDLEDFNDVSLVVRDFLGLRGQ